MNARSFSMMRNSILLFLGSTFIAVGFQNCGQGFYVLDGATRLASESSTDPAVVANGAKLYASNCVGCHGALEVSNKRNKTAAQIQTAMGNPSTGMSYLSGILSPSDITAIAAALNTTIDGSPSSEIASQKGVTANRLYITSVFNDIFTNPTNGQVYADIRAELNKWIFIQTAQFGGGCDVNTTASGQDCGDTYPIYHGATLLGQYIPTHLVSIPPQLPVSTVRQSYMLKACENIASVSTSLTYLRARMGVASGIELSEQNVSDMYVLFFRDDPPNPELLKVMMDFNAGLKANNETLDDRWRAMFSFICELPGWQSL